MNKFSTSMDRAIAESSDSYEQQVYDQQAAYYYSYCPYPTIDTYKLNSLIMAIILLQVFTIVITGVIASRL